MQQQVLIRKSRYGLLMANRWLEVRCRLAEGSLAFRDRSAGRAVIRRAYAAVELAGGDVVSTLDSGFGEKYDVRPVSDVHGQGSSVCLSTVSGQDRPGLRLFVTLYEDQPFAVMQLEVVNGSSQPIGVESFRVLTTPTAGRGRSGLSRSWQRWRFYKHGWQSWSPTLSLSCAEDDLPAPPPIVGPSPAEPQKGSFTSELVGLVTDPTTGASLLAGFVSAADQLSQVRLEMPGSLSAVSYADGVSVAAGQGLLSERLLVDVTGPPLDSLARYGDALGDEMGALGWQQVPGGWCSWYYYFGGVSEQAVVENLEFLDAHRDELPLEYIQVDDGYQADIGDWTTINDKFPQGLAWLAERIHQKGFRAGLWLAPFLAASTSALYREHPEWMVQDNDGRPVVASRNWGKECYALDCTHPGAQAWLSYLAETVVGQWGFDYLKLDFIYAGAVEGVRYDRQATRAQAYRRGLEAIGEGAGDAFILACGAPLGPSVGLVHGQRIGPDVAPYWRLPGELAPPEVTVLSRQPVESLPACDNAIRNVLSRFWMHGRLWLNDPDCLLVRDSETALSLDEVRSLATAIALSGGMVLLSDAMAKLSPERRQIASLLLPAYGQSGVTLDLLERSLPRFLRLAIERPFQRWWLMGAFRWEDEPGEVAVPLPAESVHVFDLWEERYFGVHEEEIRFPAMPAHSAKLLSLRPVSDQPQIVSTTFHFSQGGVEIEDARFDVARRALTVRLTPPARREGEVIIHVPPPYRERRLESDGATASMARRPDGLLSVRLTLSQRALFTVFFEG